MTVDLQTLFAIEKDLNDEMVKAILKAINENHQSDLDYLKFKQSVQSLLEMGMDEATSIKSAFVTLQTMGITKHRIIDSIRHYSSVVNREKDKFAIALKNQITSQIEKPKLEADKFDELIEQKKKEIEKLEREIELIQARKLTIGDELAAAETKINNTRDQFRMVYEFFAQTFDNDKILIDKLI